MPNFFFFVCLRQAQTEKAEYDRPGRRAWHGAGRQLCPTSHDLYLEVGHVRMNKDVSQWHFRDTRGIILTAWFFNDFEHLMALFCSI